MYYLTNEVRSAYRKTRTTGLNMLFLCRSFFEAVHEWTTLVICARKGCPSLTLHKLLACCGLEIAMSKSKMNTTLDYWTWKIFLGHEDFTEVMSLEKFKSSLSALCFYPHYQHGVGICDPLWHL